MAAPIAGWLISRGIGLVASFALWEGISSMFENMKNEPGNEATAIADALQRVQSSATQEALWQMGSDDRRQEALASQFRGINPAGELGTLSLLSQGVLDRTSPDRAPTLDYVSRKIGISPEELRQRSSPTRMGDISPIQNALPASLMGREHRG